ncbi:proteinrelated to nuclear pore protein [Purpureocillium lavendulum]|uniref:Proteinrelated to nuclear pore protein n=1 Tax=Purpureocillium lavendulum TaxID=1247861 RepID=A0AB34G130_9HYPO|nr:proteinrelated to nuclear pore protein [Purpureocillium lavendulum]
MGDSHIILDRHGDIEDDWTINLPDDNPVPMKVFLNIAHANFSEVPKDLTVGDLYELVVLTHYYDSTRLLTPWVETWMSSLGSKQSTPPSDMPKLLWISWEFGRREDVTTISRQMLLEFDGNWFNDTDKLEDIQTPPYIIGLWPLPEPLDVEYSLVGLYRKLTSLIIHDIGDVKGSPSEDHRQCNPRQHLLHKVQEVMNGIPELLTDYHKNRMEEQSEGLEN